MYIAMIKVKEFSNKTYQGKADKRQFKRN